jgi:hypothetical protein
MSMVGAHFEVRILVVWLSGSRKVKHTPNDLTSTTQHRQSESGLPESGLIQGSAVNLHRHDWTHLHQLKAATFTWSSRRRASRCRVSSSSASLGIYRYMVHEICFGTDRGSAAREQCLAFCYPIKC